MRTKEKYKSLITPRKAQALLFLFSASLFFFSCLSSKTEEKESLSVSLEKDNSLLYAKRFSSMRGTNFKVLYLFGNRNLSDTTATFVVYNRKDPRPKGIKNAFYIATPVDRVACLSSVYAAMMKKLGLDEKIVAIDNIDYYNNSKIIEKVEKGEIRELAKGPEMNAEQTLLLNPDLILTFGMGNPAKDVGEKVFNSGIPIAISLDHLEETPLARAEWIKFIASFFDKEALADSLFKVTESNYRNLCSLTDTVKKRPTVLTEIKYGDAWYVPGGNSFMAHFLNDAGADYIWKEEKRTGSMPLSFEAVYAKAKDAEFWVNLFINLNSKKELLSYDERYNMFTAYKNGNLYNNNRIANSKGYSDYWETGMSNPDELLKDLIYIFHPALVKDHQLRYYKKIE